MIKYTYKIQDKHEAYIQLNVENIMDDTELYGLIYAPGRSWRLNVGVTF